MNSADRPAVRDAPTWLARLLLVAFTVLGVAALHTIGHAGADLTGAPRPVAVVAAAIPQFVGGGTTTGDGCDGDGCTHQIAQPGRDRHDPAGWDVCLAVMSVLAVALAVGVLPRVLPTRAAGPAGAQRRPPPGPVAMAGLGLSIATTSVLRI